MTTSNLTPIDPARVTQIKIGMFSESLGNPNDTEGVYTNLIRDVAGHNSHTVEVMAMLPDLADQTETISVAQAGSTIENGVDTHEYQIKSTGTGALAFWYISFPGPDSEAHCAAKVVTEGHTEIQANKKRKAVSASIVAFKSGDHTAG